MTKRVHILSTVNAANVSKSGSTYTIKNVCGATDNIVMNSMLYGADQLAAGVASLNDKPAPAGHPKNAAGQHISALNGAALASAWIGSYCTNARHENGRTLVDVVVNESQAKAHPDGAKLIERLDAAIANTNAEPIHVSTGLNVEPIMANGESRGKKYSRIATNLQYDHLAILLNEQGAGTPEDGVGMFLNSSGEPEEVETVEVNTAPDEQDEPPKGFASWLKKLLVNAAFLSSLASAPDQKDESPEVEPLTNHEKEDHVKTLILAALNQAGISVSGLDDTQLLTAYNALQAKPHQDALTAANSKLAALELAANAAADAELTALATSLAVNTSLKPEDFKAMGLTRCKELAATGKAAPVVTGNAGQPADEFAGYDINAL